MAHIGAKIFTIMVIMMTMIMTIILIVIHIIMDQIIMAEIMVMAMELPMKHLMKTPQNLAIVFLVRPLEKWRFMLNQITVRMII